MAIKSILNVTAAAGVKLSTRIIAYTAFGIVFNLFLLIFFSSSAGRNSSAVPWVLLLLMALASPVVYFIMGKKQGTATALHFIMDEHGDDLSRFVVGKLADTYPQLLDSTQAKGGAIHEKLSAVITSISQQSTINKAIFDKLLEKFDFISIVTRVMEKTSTEGATTQDEKVDRIASALKSEINVGTLKPDMRQTQILVAGNAGVALVCAWVLPVIFR
ncbi:hypothetical protein H8L32_26440 [Undibacterium sp. CY18W]|uniref:Uncharacterized protein n=1 Tax=Undibacterium hunanense TaxID=2762292 RepID=A0ABR6ZZL3_9BURK|nr:hypothetical protein [Undibacterium hunanense]MBC3921030.1 hypothetical protein [Undibacterium hunanense]